MIVGAGIDIIEINRVEKAAAKPSFMSRVFTSGEIAYFEAKGMRPQSIAGGFAAKEAMAKALGTGIGQVDWKELEVTHCPNGKPEAVLHGRALEQMKAIGGSRMHISISHSREMAAAQAIAEG